MIIKVGDEYLDFDGDVIVERQIMNIETLNNVGDYSYSFTVQPTGHNKQVLGVESINESNKLIFVHRPAQLQTKDGLTIHYGYILITNTFGIECSFLSGNNNFFSLINGNVNDVDLSHLDVLLSETSVTNSWASTSGVVFPIVDRGGLSTRKDPFLKVRTFRGEVQYNDFQPFLYVKEALNGILKMAGLKMDGDLLKNGDYNNLITTNNSDKYYKKKFKDNNINIGKTISQTISDAGFTKLTFDDLSSTQYYNSPNLNYDTVNNRWTVDFDSLIRLTLSFQTSDITKEINFETRRNGVDIQDNFLSGNVVGFTVADEFSANQEHAASGDYYEIWAKVDASTPGSVNILGGTWKAEILSTSYIFAQALLPFQNSREFIKDIFKLFNVVCTYDYFTKTITTKLFKNIKTSEEQDLSIYVTGDISENGYEIVSDYAKINLLSYQSDTTDEIEQYNDANLIPYGSGNMAIGNDFIKESNELFSVNYVAPFSQLYPYYGLQLLKLAFIEYVPDELIPITSVANSGGLASLNSLYTLRNNTYRGTAVGDLYDLEYTNKNSESQILAFHIPNFTLPIPIRLTPTGGVGDHTPYRASNFTIPSYNGDWERTSVPGTDITDASLAVFAKFTDGTDIDNYPMGLSFGEIEGKDSQTLIDTYYRVTSDLLNDPVKVIVEMIMPENIYRNIDFLRPVRLMTEKYNSLFYINRDTGYINSSTKFTIELIKFG